MSVESIYVVRQEETANGTIVHMEFCINLKEAKNKLEGKLAQGIVAKIQKIRNPACF